MQYVVHTFKPIYNAGSKILILGTMPSPKSREYNFYYSHPQNRFWRILADILNQDCPKANIEKEDFVLRNHIALWDVLKSCNIEGADDNSIKNPEVNDIMPILKSSKIQRIFTKGRKATQLYKKYCLKSVGMESFYLPSTSPANCKNYNYDTLKEEYKVILEYLK